MAIARTKTTGYEIRSAATDEVRVVFERAYVKAVKAGSKYLTATKIAVVQDSKGRRYEWISDAELQAVPSGERFHVVGELERSRKTT